MSLNRPNLTIETKILEACTKLTVQDITGSYNVTTNPLGYGLPGGIVLTDITTIVINVYYPSITTPITYTMTLVAGTPTALTVKDLNSASYNIFASIGTLYVGGVFNLTGQTAFVLPKITDGIVSIDYSVGGISSSTAFNYTTNNTFLSTCSVECCITDMYKNLDLSCGCSDTDKIELAELFLSGAKKAIAIGQNDKSLCLLNEAKEICNNNCKD